MSTSTKWIIGVVVVIIIILGLWYSGVFSGIAGQSAAVANSSAKNTTPTPATVATALQKLSVDLSAAKQTNKPEAFVSLQAEFGATVTATAALAATFIVQVNAAVNTGKSVGAAQAALTDLNTKLSYLKSSAPTATNVDNEILNVNAAFSDIATINTALQAAK